MVSSVNPRTFGSQFPAWASLHVGAAVVGATALVVTSRAIVGEVGDFPRPPLSLLMLAAAASAVAVYEAKKRSPRVLSLGTQVPVGWRNALHPVAWVSLFGVLLGAVVLTRVPSNNVWIVLLAATVLPPLPAFALATSLGLARGAAVLFPDRVNLRAWSRAGHFVVVAGLGLLAVAL